MAAEDSLADDVPDAVREAIEVLGVRDFQDEPKPVKQILNRMTVGRCITCNSKVGESATVMVSGAGVVALYCGGACISDLMVMNWLDEKYGDIRQSVDFRAGSGDQPE